MNAWRKSLFAGTAVLGAGVLGLSLWGAGPVRAAETTKVTTEEGIKAFAEVAKVLQSPRCRNCHPAGNTPLHSDKGVAHSMNVSRDSTEAGLKCTTCHRSANQEGEHAPPGVPGWRMPPKETPMVFEGLSVSALCKQLKDPTKNGERSGETLVHHVGHDPFVVWAWSPGEGRSLPPLKHEDFVAQMKKWADAGMPCGE